MKRSQHAAFLHTVFGFYDPECELSLEIDAVVPCGDFKWKDLDTSPTVQEIMGIPVDGKVKQATVSSEPYMPKLFGNHYEPVAHPSCDLELSILITDCAAVDRILDILRHH